MANILDIANIQRANNRYNVRAERIKREGSPYYTYVPGIIVATEWDVLCPSTQFPISKKYEPLDWLEIVNNDAVDISIAINGHDSFLVLAKTIRTIDGLPLWQVDITNNSAVTDSVAGKIVLSLQRQPLTIDKWAR